MKLLFKDIPEEHSVHIKESTVEFFIGRSVSRIIGVLVENGRLFFLLNSGGNFEALPNETRIIFDFLKEHYPEMLI